MSDEQKPHMTELIRFEWIIRATPMPSGHVYIRPVLRERATGKMKVERHDWTKNEVAKYPKTEEEMVYAVKECRAWCDEKNKPIRADVEGRRLALERIKRVHQSHGGTMDIQEFS